MKYTYSFFGLVLILIALWLFIPIQKESLPHRDLNPAHATLFPDSYEAATARFRKDCSQLRNISPKTEARKIAIPSKMSEQLFIDICYTPAQKQPSNLLILTSGTHGTEAFVGSAIQAYFLREVLPKHFKKNLGLLLIHGLNPYGFKTFRRVSENNVDLNRNFVTDTKTFSGTNPGYQNLSPFLNPRKPASAGIVADFFFAVGALKFLIRHSMEDLRQSILQGQYQYPKGVFFGGSSYEPQVQKTETLLADLSANYQHTLLIDIHTGYGKRGKLHLYPNPIQNQKVRKQVEKIFTGFHIDYGNQDKMYTVTGGYSDYWLYKLVKKVTYYPMLFEYGTMDSQTFMGSVRSLRNMITENQGFHYGFKTKEDQKTIQKHFREMFYPSSPTWRAHILEQTQLILDSALPKFIALE